MLGSAPALAEAGADEAKAEAPPRATESLPPLSLISAVRTAEIDLGSGVSFKDLSGEKKPGFLYFRSAEGEETDARLKSRWLFQSTTKFTPRLSGALSRLQASPGDAWVLRGFTPRSAGAEFSLSYGKQSSALARRPGFDVSLSSSLTVQGVDIPGLINSASLDRSLSRQAYEFGLNIGYAGFGVAAGLKGEEGLLRPGYSGYDLGLFYEGRRWYTNILVGEYRRKLAGLQSGIGGEEFNYYSLQIGASYRLGSALDLTGGFRLIGYGKGYVFEADGKSLDQIFFLGTRLNF